jgi:hypothetical protein
MAWRTWRYPNTVYLSLPINFRLGYGYGIDTTGILFANRR